MRVLDPFAGVGTTLVEAVAGGHEAVGFEINPYAALACDAKANVPAYDAGRFADAIARFRAFADEKPWLKSPPASAPPPAFISRAPFFSPEIELQTLGCIDFIREETSGWVRRLFDLALGSVMVGFSNYSYEPSLGTRAGAGKPNIESADVAGIIERKLRDMLDDIIEFQTDAARRDGETGAAVVHPVSYMEHADRVERGSVDVVITSPPYLNNYHYIRNTRPQLYWLGLVSDPSELKKIERESFGRFWQTVRAGAEVALTPDLPHLRELLKELRSRRPEKGAYGGPGWANYAATYFNDCQRFCQAAMPLIKPGGAMVVVIGNSILQGVEFPTDRLFAEIAALEGFEIAAIREARGKRTGNSVVNSSARVGKAPKGARLYETTVELRRPQSGCADISRSRASQQRGMAKIRTARYHKCTRFSENIRDGANEIMGIFRVPIEIGDLQASRFETVEALVDTGATYTMIPRSLLARLGISPGWRRTFALADGREREFDMAETRARLGGVTVTTIVLFGEENVTPLLGAYTLEGFGLAVDPARQRLVELVGHL